MQNFLVTTVLNVLYVNPLTSINISNSLAPTLSSSEFQCLSCGNFKSPSASPSPLPSSKTPSNIARKLVIGLLLSSGAFVIAAAIIRVVLTLSANPSALTINAWGVRETIVGILTVNIPILRPIFSKSFWNGNAPSEITSSYRTTTHGTRGGNRTLTQDISGPYELTPSINEGSKPSVRGSQESIVSKTVRMADIVVSKSYQVSHDVNTYDGRSWYGDRNGASKASVHAESPV
ncbi:hypothetical protein BFJ69_g2351 [Fusarium oxysporum]|uniref:Integral membrane protein n=1 Tax=Fusarium oxysporum TaxID=5507 RepID=A0A420NUV4_FUSOX|nr:hypothetical protein BFJ69_g2351 [Fusarium oxysporum]